MFTKASVFALTSMAALFSLTSLASAGSNTGTLAVSATVVNSCTVGTSTLDFGSTLDAHSVNDGTGSVVVTCTAGSTYKVGLGTGTASGASVTTRQMHGVTPENLLPYSLYSDSTRQTNWGNTPATDTVTGTTADGAQQTITVYGRIPASASAPADTYTDSVAINVSF
jgi:spore coat protein U-like protein